MTWFRYKRKNPTLETPLWHKLRLLPVFEQDVPLHLIRHSKRQCYVEEGHGGQEIETWPIYRFLCRYIQGEPLRAEKEFSNWYLEQFVRYRDTPKRLGGMRGGSLARTLDEAKKKTEPEPPHLQGSSCGDIGADPQLFDSIVLRVRQRFRLVDSIRERGYLPDRADPVLGIRENHCVYLEGGHHRAAALLGLGWKMLPATLVFPNYVVYRAWLWYCAFGHALSTRLLGTR